MQHQHKNVIGQNVAARGETAFRRDLFAGREKKVSSHSEDIETGFALFNWNWSKIVEGKTVVVEDRQGFLMLILNSTNWASKRFEN